VSGNTEYVCISFFGNRSFILSRMKLPIPDPVPPAMEWSSMKPCRCIQHLNTKSKCRRDYLQGIASICLSVDHIEHLLLHDLSGRVARSPVVSSTNSLLANEEVLGVVDVLIRARLDRIDDLRKLSRSPWSPPEVGMLTLGSRSSRMARGIYRVSSLYSTLS
jgi:hypothetical protein